MVRPFLSLTRQSVENVRTTESVRGALTALLAAAVEDNTLVNLVVRDSLLRDAYPAIGWSNRSKLPWFPGLLLDVTEDGLWVGLRWETLSCHLKTETWRSFQGARSGFDQHQVMLAGHIGFRFIQAFDLAGTTDYAWPHLYCAYRPMSRAPFSRTCYVLPSPTAQSYATYKQVATYWQIHRRWRLI
jgi:hypothetical protein